MYPFVHVSAVTWKCRNVQEDTIWIGNIGDMGVGGEAVVSRVGEME